MQSWLSHEEQKSDQTAQRVSGRVSIDFRLDVLPSGLRIRISRLGKGMQAMGGPENIFFLNLSLSLSLSLSLNPRVTYDNSFIFQLRAEV